MEIQFSVSGLRPFLNANPILVRICMYLLKYLLIEFIVRVLLFEYTNLIGPLPASLVQFFYQALSPCLGALNIIWFAVLTGLACRLMLFPPNSILTLLLDGKDVRDSLDEVGAS